MSKYLVKRILLAILSVFVICLITFFAMNAVPGGPFNSEKALTPAVKQTLLERYNLDKPVWQQFILYMGNIFHGDFGVSLKTGRDISTTLWTCFSVSARIGGIAALLPVIALAAYPTAYVTRLTKTSMLDALSQDYIRTARSKGVTTIKVIFKHALRNALIPVITYVGPMLAYILTGSLVVENIFSIGGLGKQFVQSITNRDYPMIMATTIFLAVIMVIMNLLSDIMYKVVDPRIKLD